MGDFADIIYDESRLVLLKYMQVFLIGVVKEKTTEMPQ